MDKSDNPRKAEQFELIPLNSRNILQDRSLRLKSCFVPFFLRWRIRSRGHPVKNYVEAGRQNTPMFSKERRAIF